MRCEARLTLLRIYGRKSHSRPQTHPCSWRLFDTAKRLRLVTSGFCAVHRRYTARVAEITAFSTSKRQSSTSCLVKPLPLFHSVLSMAMVLLKTLCHGPCDGCPVTPRQHLSQKPLCPSPAAGHGLLNWKAANVRRRLNLDYWTSPFCCVCDGVVCLYNVFDICDRFLIV